MSWKGFAANVSAVVLIGLAASPASAVDREYGRSGPYIGAGALYAFENFDTSGLQSPDGSWGYDIKGGYRFNEYFALEIGWHHMLGFDDSTGDTEIFQADASAKVYPLHGVFQPYLLGGVGYNDVEDERAGGIADGAGVAFRFGGGLDFYITRNFALYAEVGYLLGTNGRGDYGTIPLTFGVLYRFF